MSRVSPIEPSPIAALRRSLGMTLAQMGEACGISKSQMHEVERSGRASVPVALRIEKLSGGIIDAARLSDDVAMARHGMEVRPEGGAPATGKARALSRKGRRADKGADKGDIEDQSSDPAAGASPLQPRAGGGGRGRAGS